LRSNNYPQLAFDLLQKKAQSNSLNRDGYLYLADEYSQNNQAELSYQNLLKAKELDPYFPQTYKQLIEAAERLGKREEAERYQKFLDSITW
jgi:predicted Zn-dependent protease